MQKRYAKRLLSLLLLVSMLLTLSFYTTADAPEAQALAEEGILTGGPDGDLRLQDPISRAELAKCLVTALGVTEEETVTFSDVSVSHWAHSYIAAAVKEGFINGFEDNTFRPEEAVTYEQAIKMVCTAFGQTAPYPFGYLQMASDSGLLDHIPAIMGEAATREDVAKLIVRSRDKAKEANTEADIDSQSAPKSANILFESSLPAPAVLGGGSGGGTLAAPPYLEGPIIHNTEEYTREEENGYRSTATSPVSTFSIDVDTASYSNMRRFLLSGQLPQLGAVRTEELIHYFDYAFPEKEEDAPFGIYTEVNACPWNQEHQLAMVALHGDTDSALTEAPSNLTFLIDVSGSMFSENKLPLVKQALSLLTEQLKETDTVSIVTYAGNAGVLLDSASGADKETILEALNSLTAYGSTAGGAGILMAYDLAEKNKIQGNNRVILCSDGDFNVGVSSTAELENLIVQKRDSGIYLSVLGFGMGNYKDNRMETLADKGNGNYAYIDNAKEAKKVLVDDMQKTIYTIAKDVKIQVEFNPAFAAQYRLLGYENRMLAAEDFQNDKKDAGEMGAGHTVIAFYEIIPPAEEAQEDSLRYQSVQQKDSEEIFYVKVRYKEPEGQESKLVEKPALVSNKTEESETFTFASAVAELGMTLNESEFLPEADYDRILERAQGAVGEDPYGLRMEFVQLVGMARYLKRTALGGTQPDTPYCIHIVEPK